MENRTVCRYAWFGRVNYLDAWNLQKSLVSARAEGLISDRLLLLEHPPTYTLGPRGDLSHLLEDAKTLEELGACLFQVDRGGDITFHGPGQLVGYPILSLQHRPGGPSRYMRDLEAVILRTLETFGISGCRIPGYTGVWVDGEKVAAIGVKINARRIAGHGFALNVSTDLSFFDRIVPCGIHGRKATSMEKILKGRVSIEEVRREIVGNFGEVFQLSMEPDTTESALYSVVCGPENEGSHADRP
ncbi:MAG TPA: lipoyl(octanoyl) transferase LipB [Syntrophobacteraceae bacterium]|nr:lipoyl(octanoyl) transferase LipB [Syntrophobacteraceae bacterium]